MLHMQKSIEVGLIDFLGLIEVVIDIIFLFEKIGIIEGAESCDDRLSFFFTVDLEDLQNNLGNSDNKIFASIFGKEWFHGWTNEIPCKTNRYALLCQDFFSSLSPKYRNKYISST